MSGAARSVFKPAWHRHPEAERDRRLKGTGGLSRSARQVFFIQRSCSAQTYDRMGSYISFRQDA
uniref:hypothetical protein n=1 Tax=Pannonibacter phragmitetus TaxID=121719 RepID=UPI000B974CA7|nr:hypothetical protein [Pannonibacter phragmitetus]